jgi:hypothetical protein
MAHSLIEAGGEGGGMSVKHDKAVDFSLWEEEVARGLPEEEQHFKPRPRVY